MSQISKIINRKRSAASVLLPEVKNPPLYQDPEAKRAHGAAWVELESALYEWYLMMQRKKVAIEGTDIKTQAAVFWIKLDLYKDKPVPQFSDGWVDNWKTRYKIKRIHLFGDHREVEITLEVK